MTSIGCRNPAISAGGCCQRLHIIECLGLKARKNPAGPLTWFSGMMSRQPTNNLPTYQLALVIAGESAKALYGAIEPTSRQLANAR